MEDLLTTATPDLSPYELHSRFEILAILRGLFERKQLLRMLITRGGDSVVTSILEVDASTDTVVLDVSSDPAFNERALEASALRFETVLDNISISFSVPGVESVTFEDRPAFVMPVPTTAIRLQRREFYRVETPRINPPYCILQVLEDDERKSLRLPLQNISAGGIAMLDESEELDPAIGTVFEGCRIELPDKTQLVVNLQIRNTRLVKLPNGRAKRRFGCMFVNLPPQMGAAVQRYITKLERERNARHSGFE